MLQDAISTYHDLLSEELVCASQEWLDAQQHRRGLCFGDRPLCTVLRPRFLTIEQYRYLRQRIRLLLQAWNLVHQRAVSDADFRKQFRLSDEEEALFALEPGYRSPMPLARLDAFFGPLTAGGRGPGELWFTEINAETPAAAAYTDELADIFTGMPLFSAFSRRYNAVLHPARPGTMLALLDAYREWRGVRERPQIAILDWKEVPTYSEFVLFQQYFAERGLPCRIVDPREVEYTQGKLRVGDFVISLIYKRVLISELLERGGLNHPVIQAVRDRAVCLVNPFRCKALYKKASLAVLSDERNTRLFSPEQQQAIANHIPWTRLVEERHSTYAGQTIDLLPFLSENRERLALKPNDDYGGKGIVLGWTVDDAAWQRALAVAQQTPYVAQERIRLPSEPFPALVEGKLHITDRLLDTAPYASHGEYVEGCLTRIATDPLLNVSAGGGSTVPTFVIEPR